MIRGRCAQGHALVCIARPTTRWKAHVSMLTSRERTPRCMWNRWRRCVLLFKERAVRAAHGDEQWGPRPFLCGVTLSPRTQLVFADKTLESWVFKQPIADFVSRRSKAHGRVVVSASTVQGRPGVDLNLRFPWCPKRVSQVFVFL